MRLSEYMEETRKTAVYPEALQERERGLLYLALGLSGEGGEVSEKIKKYLRGDYDMDALRVHLRKELGDQMWYWARMCDAMGIVPEDVLKQNLEKLADRKKRGVLTGSGDDR